MHQIDNVHLPKAMKSQYQVLTFLSQYTPSTTLDSDMITAFIEKRYRITPRTQIFASGATNLQIDAQTFIQWFENGFAASEIVKYADALAILGQCTTTTCQIIGILSGNTITPTNKTASTSDLTKSTGDNIAYFQNILFEHRLQYNPEKLSLETKFIPHINDKILFHTFDKSINGIGIVRSLDTVRNEIELYCYFIYPTKTEKSRIGYSMHECGIINFHEYVFEPLLDDNDNRFSSDDGVSAYRRLKRELEKVGKVWKDKIRRIEPADMKLDKGKKYFYITDKLTVVEETDKGTPTGQMRYLCGNYFHTQMAANIMLGKIHELIRNYLASSDWPELSNE